LAVERSVSFWRSFLQRFDHYGVVVHGFASEAAVHDEP